MDGRQPGVNGAAAAVVADEQEVAPLRRSPAPVDDAGASVAETGLVRRARAAREQPDAEAERPDATATPSIEPERGMGDGGAAAGARRPASRPIRREDVYRHRVVGGREVRETWLRRLATRLGETLKSRGEREEEALDDRLRRPATVSRMNVIAVVSPKGGVGKTTTTWLVGDALASLGRVSTLALDANPDFGTLGSLVPEARRSERTLADLLDDHPDGTEPPNAAELQPSLSALASGLRVLEAPVDSAVMARMGPEQYERLLELVERQIAVVILDCGTGLASPLAQWAMRRADQVLVVTTPDWVTANNVSRALPKALADVADKATLVVNQVRSGAAGNREAINDHFAAQAIARRHALAYDEQLRTMLDSGTYALEDARRPTRLGIKRLAVQVGEDLR